MSSLQKLAKRRSTARRNLWYERLMAILASVNLGLVAFDLSYVAWRDFYLQRLPVLVPPAKALTQIYDPIKGIEPHRDTQRYLAVVTQLQDQVEQTGLDSPEIEPILTQLRSLSGEMVDTDPFQVANKSGALERIKNRMRDRMNQESSRQAFDQFWSQERLQAVGWRGEIGFFNREIRPLIERNYYRPLGENGEPVDYFWTIDLPFVVIFGLDFLARSFYISRRHASVSWLDAMLWRWYDIFLLLPFWRWLRVIPVTIRLHQARLVNLDAVIEQVNRGFAANFAEEISEVVVMRVINQAQGAIQRGEITRWLFQPPSSRAYIDLNNTNETEAIANLFTKLLVYDVLPKIQPDVEAILRHSLTSALKPVHQSIQVIPGLEALSQQLTERLVSELTKTAYGALVASLEDPVGAQLSNQLVQHFQEALSTGVQDKHTLDRLETLLSDLLEEVKVNYIQRLSEEDLESVIEQAEQLRQLNQPHPVTRLQQLSDRPDVFK